MLSGKSVLAFALYLYRVDDVVAYFIACSQAIILNVGSSRSETVCTKSLPYRQLWLVKFSLTVVFLINILRYCEARRKVLLDHVYEGYETDVWEYIDYD